MAHVREVDRKAGRAYEVRWRDGGKERQRTFTVKRDAERFALKVENAKGDGTGTHDLTRARQTFAEVAAASLAASRSTLKPTTLAGYELLHSARLVPAFGRQRISAVTSQAVEEWVAQLLADGLAASTVRNHFVALNKVFRYAVRHRLIAVNPCDAVDVPRPGNASTFAPVFLTPAQVEAVADALDVAAPYGLLVRFAAQTGLRAAEIAGLRVRDVNLAARQVEVRQTVKKVGTAWVVNTPKSARSTRNVPIFTAGLLAALREHLLSHPSSGDPDALFWPGRRATGVLDWTRPVDCGVVRRHHLVPAARRLGIAEHMRFHDLRHTFASVMLAADHIAVYQVSRWMGHANVSTTDGIYGHLYPSELTRERASAETQWAAG